MSEQARVQRRTLVAMRHISPNCTSSSAAVDDDSDSEDEEDRPEYRPPVGSFDPKSLRHYLEGEYAIDKDNSSDYLLNNELFGFKFGLTKEEYRVLTHNRLKEVMNSPWADLTLLKENPDKAFVMSEPLAYFDLSLAIKGGVHGTLFSGAIMLLGSQDQVDRYIPRASKLEIAGLFGMTENGHGSNVRQIETTATYDAKTEEFVINTPTKTAEKWYLGNALNATHGVIFAQLLLNGRNEGPHAFIIQLRENGQLLPGIEARDNGEKIGLNGVDNGILRFSNVRIPRKDMLCKYATVSPRGEYWSEFSNPNTRFNGMLSALIITRIGLINTAVAVMKVGLSIAIRYAFGRAQFGPPGADEKPIIEYTTHQRRLMPYLASCYAMNFTRKAVTQQWVDMTPKSRRSVEAIISGLKAYATWQNSRALQECRECCGGQGYLAENRIGLLRADSDIFVTFEGDNVVLMQQVAKDLLVQYQKRFTKSSIAAARAFFSQSVVGPVMERVPPLPRKATERYLRSRDFVRNAFLYQESKLLHTVAMRLKHKVMDSGMEGFDAWNQCLPHLLSLSICHVERVVYETSLRASEDCPDPAVRSTLRTMSDLFGLSRLEDKRAWYLEHGYFSRHFSKRIRTVVQKLCGDVKQNALPLCHAFGIDERIIHAPIALNP